MRYSVRRHLDRIKLQVFTYKANDVYRDLVLSLKESTWCSFDRHYIKGRNVTDSFSCKDRTRITLTYVSTSCFYVTLSDPTPVVQRRVLSLLKRGVTANLSEVEFALNFYPVRSSDLDSLFSLLSRSVVLQRSRGNFFSYCANREGFTITFYQGCGGNVRPSKYNFRPGMPKTLTIGEKGNLKLSEAKPETCGRGLRIYKTEDGAVRVELQLNRDSMRKLRPPLSVRSLPLSADQVDVLDYVEFRRTLDEDTQRT